MRLGTNPDGDLQFTVTDTVEEAQDAARALQVNVHLCSSYFGKAGNYLP